MNSPPPGVWKIMFLLYWLDMVPFPLRGYPIHSWHPQDGSGQIEWVEFQADSRLQQLIVAEVMRSFDSDYFLDGFSYTSLPFWLAKKMNWNVDVDKLLYNYYSPTLFFVSTMGFWDFYLYRIYVCCKAAVRLRDPPNPWGTGGNLLEVMENFQAQTALKWLCRTSVHRGDPMGYVVNVPYKDPMG